MSDITNESPKRSKLSISAMRFVLENCLLCRADEWDDNDMLIVIKVDKDSAIQTFLYSKMRWAIVTGKPRY